MNPLTLHRAARAAARRGIPLLARVLDAVGFVLFSCSVPHTAEIGERTILTHRGLGVVIAPGTVVGADCVIAPHCVLGSRHVFNAPRLEDDVHLGAGAIVIGEVTLGRGARIGAGSVVLGDVPPGGVAVGNPARLVSPARRGDKATGR